MDCFQRRRKRYTYSTNIMKQLSNDQSFSLTDRVTKRTLTNSVGWIVGVTLDT